jgi:hypothetical protein
MTGIMARFGALIAVRRNIVLFSLVPLASAGMVVAGAAPAAFACDTSSSNNHCYAIAQNNNTATNHGIFGVIDVSCLYQPDNGNQARAEIWDATIGGGGNWIEAGLISGVDYNGTYRNKNWVWADQRPGQSYAEHDFSQTASTATGYPTEIEYTGTNTWEIYGENSFVEYGVSTGNTATLVTGQAGTEYEGSSTSGIRDIGEVSSLERYSSANVWYDWTNAGNADLGPGNYISSTYGSAEEDWSGPC